MSFLRQKIPCSRATTERILAELQDVASSLRTLRREFDVVQECVDRMEQGSAVTPATLDALLTLRRVLGPRLAGLPGGRSPRPRRLAGAPALPECFARLERLAPRAYVLWREALDANAKTYEGFPVDSCSVAAHPMAERFRRFLAPHLRGRVLDIGCGPQPVPLYLADYPAERISGLDPLSQGEQHAFDFASGVAEFMPWEDAQFDTVIAATSLDHVLLLDRALDEMARVLKPDGRCLLWVAFVPGARPYDPHGDDVAMVDQYHLFHFDRAWFFERLGKHFDVVESLEVMSGCHQCFCTLAKKPAGVVLPEAPAAIEGESARVKEIFVFASSGRPSTAMVRDQTCAPVARSKFPRRCHGVHAASRIENAHGMVGAGDDTLRPRDFPGGEAGDVADTAFRFTCALSDGAYVITSAAARPLSVDGPTGQFHNLRLVHEASTAEVVGNPDDTGVFALESAIEVVPGGNTCYLPRQRVARKVTAETT